MPVDPVRERLGRKRKSSPDGESRSGSMLPMSGWLNTIRENAMSVEDDKLLARHSAEVADKLYDIDRPRERRIELIAVHIMRALRIGFVNGRNWKPWRQTG